MPKILIADDNEIIRQVLKALLTEEGWTVCGEAVDGQQAVDLAHELNPELIILDLAMPLLDGLHAGREIHKLAPSVPIVLYTLHKNAEIELEAKKAGAKAVVSKSDEPAILLNVLKKILAEASAATSPLAAMNEMLFTTIPAPSSSTSPLASAVEAMEPLDGAPAASTPELPTGGQALAASASVSSATTDLPSGKPPSLNTVNSAEEQEPLPSKPSQRAE